MPSFLFPLVPHLTLVKLGHSRKCAPLYFVRFVCVCAKGTNSKFQSRSCESNKKANQKFSETTANRSFCTRQKRKPELENDSYLKQTLDGLNGEGTLGLVPTERQHSFFCTFAFFEKIMQIVLCWYLPVIHHHTTPLFTRGRGLPMLSHQKTPHWLEEQQSVC